MATPIGTKETIAKANGTSPSLERGETILPAMQISTLEAMPEYNQESSDEQHLWGETIKIQGPMASLHIGQMGPECGSTWVHH